MTQSALNDTTIQKGIEIRTGRWVFGERFQQGRFLSKQQSCYLAKTSVFPRTMRRGAGVERGLLCNCGKTIWQSTGTRILHSKPFGNTNGHA